MFDLGKSNIFERRRGHPPSTYTQMRRGGVKPSAYDCVQGGGGAQGYVRTQKKILFWTTKSQNFSFFVQKKVLHCHLLCIEKCKPALSYK